MEHVDRRSVERRTQLATVSGLRVVPIAAFIFLFGVGELGWTLGAWYLPTLGVALVVAVAGTVAAERWHRARFGRVAPRWDWRVVGVVVVFIAALLVARWLEPPGLDSPIFATGVLLGTAIAALSWRAPWAYAHHLIIGGLLVIASALPLGLWVDVALPPAAAGLAEPVHPLAAYERLVAPAWLIIAGLVEHVRLVGMARRPAVVATS